jgi:hypothetical protein
MPQPTSQTFDPQLGSSGPTMPQPSPQTGGTNAYAQGTQSLYRQAYVKRQQERAEDQAEGSKQ